MAFNSKRQVKNFILLLISTFVIIGAAPSCKKSVDNKAEDYIMNLITDGRWYIYEFTEDQINAIDGFYGYEFQFHKNNTVDCIRFNTKETGSWTPDITNYTITAHFPSASYPLVKLNTTWKIIDSYTNAVTAVATVASVDYKMTLVKK